MLKGKNTFLKLYAVTIALVWIGFTSLYILVPGVRKSFVLEDHLTENLTVLFGMTSFLLGLIYLKAKADADLWKAYFMIPLLGLLGSLDEISFGERIWHLTMPTLLGVKIDAIHDFIKVAYVALKTPHNGIVYAGVTSIVAFVVIGFVAWLHWIHKQRYGLFKIYPALKYVTFTITFVAIAQVLDLDLIRRQFLEFNEELLEMIGAITLTFAALSLKYEKPTLVPLIKK